MLQGSSLLIFALCVACTVGYTIPNTISFGSDIIPESFTYLPTYYSMGGQFLTGSLSLNQLILVSYTGQITPYWQLPKGMEGNIQGLYLDVTRDRLVFAVSRLVLTNGVYTSTKGTLWSIKLPLNGTTGSSYPEAEFYVDLGASFANDATVDDKGNIYVTDTSNNRIIKVDSLGTWQVLATDNDLLYRANGIEHVKGYLLVGAENGLTRISLNTTVPQLQYVQVNGAPVPPLYDGIRFDPCKFQLAVNTPYTLGIIESNDDWKTAFMTFSKDTGDTCRNTATVWIDYRFFYNCVEGFLSGQTYSINSIPRIIPHFWKPENKVQLDCMKCSRLGSKCTRQ